MVISQCHLQKNRSMSTNNEEQNYNLKICSKLTFSEKTRAISFEIRRISHSKKYYILLGSVMSKSL